MYKPLNFTSIKKVKEDEFIQAIKNGKLPATEHREIIKPIISDDFFKPLNPQEIMNKKRKKVIPVSSCAN